MRRERRIAEAVVAGLLAGLALGPGAPAWGAASAAPSCASTSLNTSAVAGGAVTVSPMPDSQDASHRTQISFLGVPAAEISVLSVVGSQSGVHPGSLLPYSQGDGASFIPSAPFSQGEVVSVRASLREGAVAKPFSWHFTTAVVDSVSRSLETPPPPPPPPNPAELQHFVSRPDLEPPTVTVTKDSGVQAPGDLFLAPYAGPGQYGPMILEPDGGLLWFDPLPAGSRAADLRVQDYEGRPVLTWWQDPLLVDGHGGAGVVIDNSSYQQIATIRAGNGYQTDLHAFETTPQDTALFTVYDAIRCNLSAYGGPAHGAVADTLFQEIDLRTGLVRFEWHALDHVALADSYMSAAPSSTNSPWDYFHINAVSRHGGDVLVNSRNTWAAYRVNARSGQIVWSLGGRHSSFAMAPGTAPAWQHDAREGPEDTITFFDNNGTQRVHPQSRAIVLRLNTKRMTATLVSSFTHVPPLRSASQGDLQPQPDGDWVVGWGQEPFLSEFSPAGTLLLDAHLPPLYQSFTVLDFPWSGEPTESPRVGLLAPPGGGLDVYASWNGATGVAQWRVFAGASLQTLTPLLTAARSGFETEIALPTVPQYVAVQALGAEGQVLGSSAAVAG